MQKINVLTGITVSLLISVGSIYPAIAGSVSELAQPIKIAQVDSFGNVTGKIRSIVGDVVTLDLPNGDTKSVSLTRTEIFRQSLVPGMDVTINAAGTEVSLAQPITVAEQSLDSTTTTIESSPAIVSDQTTPTTTQLDQTTTTQVVPVTTDQNLSTPVVQEVPVTTDQNLSPPVVQEAPVIVPQAW